MSPCNVFACRRGQKKYIYVFMAEKIETRGSFLAAEALLSLLLRR